MCQNAPPHCQRGMTLLESLVVLLALVAMIVLVATQVQQGAEQALQVATAQRLKKVSNAAHAYLLDHFSQIIAEEMPSPITLPQLMTAGYLANTFAPKQPADQQPYQVRVIKDENNQLQLWVTTQGVQRISPRAWRYLGPLLGRQGGYIDHTFSKPAHIIGWPSSEKLPWPTALDPAPEAGQLVIYEIVKQPERVPADTLLYRRKIPGSPQLNHMLTDLNLGQHQIILQQDELPETARSQISLNAQALQFQHPAHPAQALLQIGAGNDAQPQPHINLYQPQENRSLRLAPSAVSLQGAVLPEQVKPVYTLNSSLKTLIRDGASLPEQDGSQLHHWWSKLPYHALPAHYYRNYRGSRRDGYPRSDKITLFANKICSLNQVKAVDRVGRLFMLGNANRQLGTVYICGKQLNPKGVGTQAYVLFSVDRPLSLGASAILISPDPHSPFKAANHPEEHQQTVVGIAFPKTVPTDPQQANRIVNFLQDFLPRVQLFLKLEEEICQRKTPTKSSRMDNYEKSFAYFYSLLEEVKKDRTSLKFLSEKEGPYQTFCSNFSKRHPEYQEPLLTSTIPLFIRYYRNHRPEANPISPSKRNRDNNKTYMSSHSKSLKDIWQQLSRCQDAEKKLDIKKFAEFYQSATMQNFIKQCRDFRVIQDEAWASTLYLITTLVEEEYPELNLIYAEDQAADDARATVPQE